MAHLSLGESSKPQSPQKAYLLGELADAKRRLNDKEKEMRQLVEMMQKLEETQERKAREKRWDPRRATTNYMDYGSQREEQDWRMHNFEERHHQHQPPKTSFSFVKLPSFSGESDPNLYLGWEVKIEQIFNVYEVEEDKS